MTAGDPQAIERFLEEATQTVNLEDVYLYGVKQNGRQFYGVTYGNYPTLEDTITAMGTCRRRSSRAGRSIAASASCAGRTRNKFSPGSGTRPQTLCADKTVS